MKRLMTIISATAVALPVAMALPLAVAVPTQASASHEGVGQWCSPYDTSRRCINVYACVRAGWDRYTCEGRHRYD